MPIQIPNDLPATGILQQENIFVMTENRAVTQDIRPLEIVLVNLMPTKVATETQLSRLLGNTPLQVRLELVNMKSHVAKNVGQDHLLNFYKSFDEIKHRKFDGMVITGAPVEHMPFEDVDYWQELCQIMEWSKTNVHSTFHICWGAQAGLYYHYGIQKKQMDEKLFGVFEHTADYKRSILLRGFDDTFWVPHSRHTTVLREDVEKVPGLKIIASSEKAGVYGCGYNSDMTGDAPKAHLTAAIWNWNVYYKTAMEAAMKCGTADKFVATMGTPADYGGLKENFVDVSPLSENCAPNTDKAIAAVRKMIVDGEWDVFSGVKLSIAFPNITTDMQSCPML